MGYTVYYPQQRAFTDEEWQQICGRVEQIFVHAQSQGIELVDSMGEPGTVPEVSHTEIAFNGSGDDAHESFYLPKTPSGDFNFTKTAEKPYDVVVKAVLIIVEHIAPGALDLSCDGPASDWDEAREYVEFHQTEPLRFTAPE